MTVEDFIDLFTEPCMQLIEVYDFDTDQTIFSGDATDCPDSIARRDITSLDPTRGPRITINVGGDN